MSARTVAVVGAGAAGLTAALRAAESGARVTLLNAHPRIGLKILMSGGTRCNVTHREVTARDYHGGSRAVIARILRAFTPEQTRQWFESLGVRLKLEETGKYFPESDDAQTVLDALLEAVRVAGVEVVAGARVVRLERVAASEAGASGPIDVCAKRSRVGRTAVKTAPNAGGVRFRLGIQRVRESAAFGAGAVAAPGAGEWPLPAVEVDEWRESDAVILSSGGLSFPRTGSDGVGYALVSSLGHTIVPPVPALTPLTASDPLCGAAQGVTLEAELTLRVDGRRVAATRGSLLIAHFGFSGPAALDLSRHWHRAEGAGERGVMANLVPGRTVEALEREWVEAARREPRARVRRSLSRWIPERIAEIACGEAGVEAGALAGQVAREARRAVIVAIAARDLRVTGTLGYEKAEVTAGGVPLAEADPSTLESRRCPGLHLCGEILDVEGRLGGFNFQWAWSSGTVAGRSAAAR